MSNLNRDGQRESKNLIYGEKVGLIWKLFGCRHERLSRPFTRYNASFRTCLECGARTPFDNNTFETVGEFYLPPIVRNIAEI